MASIWPFGGRSLGLAYYSIPQDSWKVGLNENSTRGEPDDPSCSRNDSAKRHYTFYQVGFWVLSIVCLFEALPLLLHSRLLRNKDYVINSPVPFIPSTTRIFKHSPPMDSLETVEDVERAWSNYETTAFIHLKNPEDYALYPNNDVIPGTQNIYMISAHHQLHCLKKLHIAVTLLAHPPDNSTTEMLLGGVKHAEHCFDYLRQGILCAADSALEGPTPESNLLGYDVQHQCREWDGKGGLEEWRRDHDWRAMK